jgi:hypothetical protein
MVPDITGTKPAFEPCCLATTIGSLPHTDLVRGTALMFEKTPEVPSWVQFPKRSLYENMMVQFTEGMPGLVQDGGRFYIDTAGRDFVEQLTDFYARYLAATEHKDSVALDSFGLSAGYAAGFTEFTRQLPGHAASHRVLMLKGQVTGPFTMGVNLLDQNQRCSYYDEQLRDVIVKTVAMRAMWQVIHLAAFFSKVMIFLDEPSLLGFGSQAFLTVGREDVIKDINEVAGTVHGLGGLAGVHCEENTDWSLLMETSLDILDFDAYDHMRGITLYPDELRAFLRRGGCLGWGIVPTLDKEAAASETVTSLLDRFEKGIRRLEATGLERKLLVRRALITPSCGVGGVLTEVLAERVLGLLRELSLSLRRLYGFP